MRNHSEADHHSTHDYLVMSDDIIRFADQFELDKFTVMGHSMGGRTAMTLAARYPDRVDGCISVDAAPVNENDNFKFGSFAESVLKFMVEMGQKEGMTGKIAVENAKEFFAGKPQFVALV